MGETQQITIKKYHDRRRPASVLTPANTIHRSSRRHRSSNNNESSEDVIDKRELKFDKYEREKYLADRRSNTLKHAVTHKCSAYCIRKRKLSERFDPVGYGCRSI